MAIELGARDPANAYRLLRVAQRYRPGGSVINKMLWSYWRFLLADCLRDAGSFTLPTLLYLFRTGLTSFATRIAGYIGFSSSGRSTPYDIECVARGLENSDPQLAYGLIRLMALEEATPGYLSELQSRLHLRLSGHVLTARSDGTTERLNGIICGLIFARAMQLPFSFSWATNVGAIHNALCSVTNDLPNFIHPKLVENHYIPYSEMQQYRIAGMDHLACEAASGIRLRAPVTLSQRDQILKEHLNIVPPTRLLSGPDQPFGAQLLRDLENVIPLVLDPAYLALFAEMRGRFRRALGVHYRGGDVIYGQSRHGVLALGDKSAPLPVVESLIQRSDESTVVIFGTAVGDTLTEMNYLRDRYSNVVLASDFWREGFDEVIQDSMMMAACRHLVAAGRTGVAHLAKMLNPELSFQPFIGVFTTAEYYQICMDNLDNPDYSSLQRSYINIQALAVCNDNNVPASVRERLISNVSRLDPKNMQRWRSTVLNST
ncbi:hypothetical protein EY643_01550 [Halioglobus maricola]|uniref:Uncharacterized protein n=1 Tax=Halioglobus maricola TaxID=2601894 RepID=A0A5P9NF99_9GAMM|nr:hypothetical protein [Halioglobus maricola]QFU74442.1 hypothetical protein EY643_01550 [Halioglobus maricola]